MGKCHDLDIKVDAVTWIKNNNLTSKLEGQ